MPEHKGLHPAEEALESYIMNSLAEDDLDQLEQHLLICEDCRDRLDAAEAYVATAREAARQILMERPAAEPARASWWRASIAWLSLRPTTALATVAAALMISFLVTRPAQTPTPLNWQTVVLETWRGQADSQEAAAGNPLAIRLNAQGLPGQELQADIVDTNGSIVATLPVRPAGGWVELRHAPGLKAGGYWVRLSLSTELLREYALVVKKTEQ